MSADGNSIVVNDVGPRDGLQNQPRILTVEQRLQLIGALADAGVSSIEVGSFVSPKAVPAMAGTDELVAGLAGDDGIHYTALIPNMKGYELARAAGACSVPLNAWYRSGLYGLASNLVFYALLHAGHGSNDRRAALRGPHPGSF